MKFYTQNDYNQAIKEMKLKVSMNGLEGKINIQAIINEKLEDDGNRHILGIQIKGDGFISQAANIESQWETLNGKIEDMNKVRNKIFTIFNFQCKKCHEQITHSESQVLSILENRENWCQCNHEERLCGECNNNM